jgi:hypothetical protein
VWKTKKTPLKKALVYYHKAHPFFVFVLFFSLSFTLPFSYFSIIIRVDNNDNELPPPPPTTFGVPSS